MRLGAGTRGRVSSPISRWFPCVPGRFRTRGTVFSKVPKRFRTQKTITKISSFTELFFSHISNMKKGFRHAKFGAYTLIFYLFLFFFKIQIGKDGFAGPKKIGAFEKRAPGVMWVEWLSLLLVVSGFPKRFSHLYTPVFPSPQDQHG